MATKPRPNLFDLANQLGGLGRKPPKKQQNRQETWAYFFLFGACAGLVMVAHFFVCPVRFGEPSHSKHWYL